MDQEQLFDKLYSLNLQLTAKNDQKKRKPVFYPEWEKDPTDTNDDVYYGLRYKPEAKKTLRSTWMQSEFESHRSSSA
ncbi:pC84L [African swine fever virus]|uniref:Uncharacterized protein C76L n=2 Tax=African swine fever virus TaxID=10497 RepID=C76L_ASFB7|nr:RecName: Full=Uncharacterized protein C76L [African swine fever virus BA71V]QID21225.1 pC84L [African swine fever virus]QZK26766.1 putative protein pC84L [African swine fever virus]WAS30509.1 putative protein pC84L [African swine fever virus]CAD5338199.1 pC84L [African swine fever virus]